MSSTVAGLLQVAILIALLAAVYKPLGDYLARVFTDKRHLAVERVIYRTVRVHPDAEQRWPVYAAGVLGFSFVSIVLLYLILRAQPLLPFGFDALAPG
jgi:K+-transporting ATPase ATPase A chain